MGRMSSTCANRKTLSGIISVLSHRRKVRLAGKEGVRIQEGMERLDTVYGLVRDTLKRSKLGFMGYQAFERYVVSLKNNVKVLVAEYQGAVHGCVVVPFSEFGGYYVYGGSAVEPATGATNLLHWEAMRQLRALGVKRYDFVGVRKDPEKGSKQEGLSLYKQRLRTTGSGIHVEVFSATAEIFRVLAGSPVLEGWRYRGSGAPQIRGRLTVAALTMAHERLRGRASGLRDKIRRNVGEVGLGGTLRRAARYLIRNTFGAASSSQHDFDLKYGTDTSGHY